MVRSTVPILCPLPLKCFVELFKKRHYLKYSHFFTMFIIQSSMVSVHWSVCLKLYIWLTAEPIGLYSSKNICRYWSCGVFKLKKILPNFFLFLYFLFLFLFFYIFFIKFKKVGKPLHPCGAGALKG